MRVPHGYMQTLSLVMSRPSTRLVHATCSPRGAVPRPFRVLLLLLPVHTVERASTMQLRAQACLTEES